MHRTQVSLDEPLYEALRQRAFDRRISMSAMVREALADYLGVDAATLEPVEEPAGDGAAKAEG
jgi:hypothetical protein